MEGIHCLLCHNAGTTKRQMVGNAGTSAAAKYGVTGPSNNSKVAGGSLVVGQTPTLASLKLGGGQGLQEPGSSGGTYKFKANNATAKSGSKYISPYSLRHLGGAGS